MQTYDYEVESDSLKRRQQLADAMLSGALRSEERRVG